MKQLKKTLLTLAALFAMTAGAWADGTLQVTEIKASEFSAWDGDETTLSAADLPGFKAMTFDEAKAWADVPASGDVILIYAFDGDDAKYVYFNNGAYNGTNSESISRAAIYYATYVGQQIFYTGAPASSEPQTLDLTEAVAGKQWTAVMPAGNVTLEPEYYPQAALAAAPTAINDVPATTDGAIVKAGTVANIGSTETAQGTVMYYVSPSALDDAALLALAADQWTADVPTAADLAQGQAYVYYYVRGNDSDTDDEIFSDGDILATNALTVTIAAEPTYAVTFAEGTEESDKWKADPATGVKKGETVTVTYTGSKKVIGVKAEKKAEAPAKPLANATAEDLGKIAGADGNIYDTKAAAEAANTTAVAMIAYVGSASDCTHGLAIALADESGTKTWSAAGAACSGKTAVTGGTWRLPSIKDWQYMFIGCGASGSYSDSPSTMSYSELATKLTTANGTALQTASYWSSTESYPGEDAWSLYFEGSSASFFSGDYEGGAYPIRACLAF